jgi:predicted lipoprotein with Yx(FWY)xxD motif
MSASVRSLLAPLGLALVLAACATTETPAPAKVADGVLTGPNGLTLYTLDRDTAGSGKSTCNGQCATNWPPLFAADTAKDGGEYTVVTRDDGKKQYAYKGKPLYYWVKDTKPGDKTGQGVGGVWKLATP